MPTIDYTESLVPVSIDSWLRKLAADVYHCLGSDDHMWIEVHNQALVDLLRWA